MKWNEYILNHVFASEEIETFYTLKINDEGKVVVIPKSRAEGAQLKFQYVCDICHDDHSLESEKLLKEHFKKYHEEE